jgi:hypothetical protein
LELTPAQKTVILYSAVALTASPKEDIHTSPRAKLPIGVQRYMAMLQNPNLQARRATQVVTLGLAQLGLGAALSGAETTGPAALEEVFQFAH